MNTPRDVTITWREVAPGAVIIGLPRKPGEPGVLWMVRSNKESIADHGKLLVTVCHGADVATHIVDPDANTARVITLINDDDALNTVAEQLGAKAVER